MSIDNVGYWSAVAAVCDSRMCGVRQIPRTPSPQNRSATRTDCAGVADPSSTPGSRCECRSTKGGVVPPLATPNLRNESLFVASVIPDLQNAALRLRFSGGRELLTVSMAPPCHPQVRVTQRPSVMVQRK
jgi:hypothetical protein